MIALHQNNADELEADLAAHGETGSHDGSFMSTVNRAVISIRSLFGGLDESIRPGLIDGEQRIIGYYDDALKTCRPGRLSRCASSAKFW